MRHAATAVVLVFVSLPISAQEGERIRREILATYDFAPHSLTTEQINAKSRILDAWWKKAEAQKAEYVPALRAELGRADAPVFFLYDGSMLLLRLSNTPADRQVALQAIARCDLEDVQHSEYFRQVHRLGILGEDTATAAMHVLAAPKFTVFIPQHALTLGQDYSLVYLLLSTDPSRWLTRVTARLGSETSEIAQKSLLLVLWYAQTAEADAAIRSFASDPSKPTANRDHAKALLARADKATLFAKASAALESEEAIRKARQDLLKRVSDEALHELDEKTARLIAKRR